MNDHYRNQYTRERQEHLARLYDAIADMLRVQAEYYTHEYEGDYGQGYCDALNSMAHEFAAIARRLRDGHSMKVVP